MCCSPLKTAKPSLWTYLLRCMMLFSHLLLQYDPTKSLADKWHWKFNLPPPSFCFFFSLSFSFLIIEFCFFYLSFLWPTLITHYHTGEGKQKNPTWCVHMLRGGDADGAAKWPLDLPERDQWHMCPSVDGRCWAEFVRSRSEKNRQLNPSIIASFFLDAINTYPGVAGTVCIWLKQKSNFLNLKIIKKTKYRTNFSGKSFCHCSF